LKLELEEVAGDAGTSSIRPANDSDREEPKQSRTALWIGVGVTSAFAVGTGVMAILTAGAKTDFESEIGGATTPERVDDKRSRLKTFAGITDGLAIATLAAGVVTIVIATSDSGTESSPSARRPAAPSVALSVVPGGARVHGTF
jgi:hypothetical protein